MLPRKSKDKKKGIKVFLTKLFLYLNGFSRPYCAAHLSLDKENNIIYDGNAIEFQHSLRAQKDILRQAKTTEQLEESWKYGKLFLEAQNDLFTAMYELLKQRENVGILVKPDGKKKVLSSSAQHFVSSHTR